MDWDIKMGKIFGIIYKITNKINGKIYIGQTTWSLQIRWRNHRSSSSKCSALYEDIKKYGRENFILEEICKCYSRKQLDSGEKYYIKFFNSRVPFGYNRTEGGDGFRGKHTEESKKKIALAHTGKKHTKESKNKMSGSNKISQNTPEAKKNKSISATGNTRALGYKHTEDAKFRMSKSREGNTNALGYKWTEEARKQFSDTWNNKSDEEKRVINKKKGDGHRGFRHTKESKNKMSVAKKGKTYPQHIQWHKNRGIINPNCKFCIGE
jgi:hypothetical protein